MYSKSMFSSPKPRASMTRSTFSSRRSCSARSDSSTLTSTLLNRPSMSMGVSTRAVRTPRSAACASIRASGVSGPISSPAVVKP